MPERRANITAIGTGNPTSTEPPEIVQSLSPPQIYPASGDYPESASPLTVSLYNPNPGGTWMLYSINSEPFETYSGPFQVTENSTVLAFAEGNPSNWTSSVQTSNSWTFIAAAPPTELAPPLIALSSADRFGVVVFSSSLKYNSSNILEPATQENKDTVIAALQGLSAGDGTNYQVALSAALSFNPQPVQVVMLSDGRPNSQNYSGTLTQLQSAGITVNTVAFDADSTASSILSSIANLMGGEYVDITE
ncbi:VWA domain-containing protein [Verrucomicrobiales bacterium]|nr:VWA domain-containing protein [Verrucomicrobiales bacterium]MDB4359152.1 VWA domain-containing protein [Verrucomicrobiales bacterium]